MFNKKLSTILSSFTKVQTQLGAFIASANVDVEFFDKAIEEVQEQKADVEKERGKALVVLGKINDILGA